MFWNQGVTSWFQTVRSASGVWSETGKVVWTYAVPSGFQCWQCLLQAVESGLLFLRLMFSDDIWQAVNYTRSQHRDL